jgi:hypothetical protein
VADSLAPHVENARDKAGPALADARDRAVPVILDARDRAVPVLKDARDRAVPVLKDARDKAAPYVDTARGVAAPYVDTALTRAAPLVETARDRLAQDVLPVVTAALAAVDEATEELRTEALKRSKAVVAAAKGEEAAVPEPRSHRLRTLLIALGLGGVVFAVARRLGNRQPSTTWQSSYTPPPAPTPPAAAPAPVDAAASDPAEAAADAAEVPHDATTPDTPVTEIDVDR